MKKVRKRKKQINTSLKKNLKRVNVKTKSNYNEQLRKNIEHIYKESHGFDQYCWDQSYDSMVGITDEEYEKRIEDLCSSDAMIKHLFE